MFLNFLRGDSKTFRVRGHHATVYAVDLPPWIPDEILQKMVAEFRASLLRELVEMMDEMAQLEPKCNSMESDSGLSAASHESAAVAIVHKWNHTEGHN